MRQVAAAGNGTLGDGEAVSVHAENQGLVQLQQWFATGEDHVFLSWVVRRPQAVDGVRQGPAVRKLAAALAIGSDKVGVAELARGAGAVDLAARPQVAAAEATKHRWPTRVRALALQGVEDLFDAVNHGMGLRDA